MPWNLARVTKDESLCLSLASRNSEDRKGGETLYESVITTVRPCDKITLKLNGFNWQVFILTHNLVDLGSLMMEAGLARLVPKL